MNPKFSTLLRLAAVTMSFEKAQREVIEPEIEALTDAKGRAHGSTVGVGVLTAIRDVMLVNTFPEIGNSFDKVNEEIFALTMTNISDALSLDHEQVANDVGRIAKRAGEAMYQQITAANGARAMKDALGDAAAA